jgi:hypothetical protein
VRGANPHIQKIGCGGRHHHESRSARAAQSSRNPALAPLSQGKDVERDHAAFKRFVILGLVEEKPDGFAVTELGRQRHHILRRVKCDTERPQDDIPPVVGRHNQREEKPNCPQCSETIGVSRRSPAFQIGSPNWSKVYGRGRESSLGGSAVNISPFAPVAGDESRASDSPAYWSRLISRRMNSAVRRCARALG